MTLGNALRRVLLSSLQGAAVTSIQVEGVLHEFPSIPAWREDVTDIVLNISGLRCACTAKWPAPNSAFKAQGPGEVTAKQIETGSDIEIMNPELVICTLDRSANLVMELTVESGCEADLVIDRAAQGRYADWALSQSMRCSARCAQGCL